jgi:hypothetical protein
MIPMFGQSWSVFAPAPINGDHYFDVRAVLGEGDDEQVTDWVRATDVELSLAQHNLFPPRAASLGVNVAAGYKHAFDDLNDDHRTIVGLDYLEENWQPRLEHELKSYSGGAAVDAYLDAEGTATAYATQVAYAVWGGGVTRVQFQVSRQNVVPFDSRNDPAAEKPPLQVAHTGWRGPVEREGQSREQFAEYFCSAPEDVCR